jgi:hypothetical protein
VVVVVATGMEVVVSAKEMRPLSLHLSRISTAVCIYLYSIVAKVMMFSSVRHKSRGFA